MISLGIVDIVLILLILIALYSAIRRRGVGASLLVALILLMILIERLAPGTLASIGNAIHSLDQVNNAGPHVTIEPIIRFQK